MCKRAKSTFYVEPVNPVEKVEVDLIQIKEQELPPPRKDESMMQESNTEAGLQ